MPLKQRNSFYVPLGIEVHADLHASCVEAPHADAAPVGCIIEFNG
jgi:hypothetical protein